MSKQDAVVPGLRVHLHQQGFAGGFDGVLIMTGHDLTIKDALWRCVSNDYGERDPVTAAEAGLEGVSSARSGRLGRCGHL